MKMKKKNIEKSYNLLIVLIECNFVVQRYSKLDQVTSSWYVFWARGKNHEQTNTRQKRFGYHQWSGVWNAGRQNETFYHLLHVFKCIRSKRTKNWFFIDLLTNFLWNWINIFEKYCYRLNLTDMKRRYWMQVVI